jgi:pimeloyl-ACP methyl ester carboxylesterase
LPVVTRNGVEIHFDVVGEGPPIAILPGLGGNNQVGRLAGWADAFPENKVVLIEPRGHGQSGRPAGVEAHRIEEYRDDVREVLISLGATKAVSLGISDGGEIGYALAEGYPDLISAHIDIDGVDGADMCDSPNKEGRLELAKSVRTRGWAPVIGELVASTGVQGEPPILKSFYSEDPEMVALELEAWTRWRGPLSVVRTLVVPVLMMLNGQRKSEEIDRIRIAAGERAEIHVIPDVNHWKICTQPELCMPAIRAFLGS